MSGQAPSALERRIVTVVLAGLAAVLSAGATLGPVHAAVAAVVAVFVLALALLGRERTAVATLMLAFGTAPMYRGLEDLTAGLATPTDLLLLVGVLLLVPTLLERPLSPPLVFVAGVSLVGICGLLVAPLSDPPDAHLFALLQWLFFLGVLPAVVAWWHPSRWVLHLLLWAYLAGHLVSATWAVLEGPQANDRFDGLTHHSNAFGLAGLMGLAITLFLFHEYRALRSRALVVAAGAVCLLSIASSGSRSSTLVAIVLVLMIPVVERSALSGFLFAIGGALAVFSLPLLVSVSSEGSAISRLAGDATTLAADRSRDAAFDHGVDRFLDSPIVGSGLVDVDLIHNTYLEALVGIGIIGALGYVVVLFVLARPLFADTSLRRLSYLAWVVVGIGPALPGLWDRTIWVPVALVMLAVLERAGRYEAGRARQPGQATSAASVAG